MIQRDPLSSADDPQGYTQPAGVSNVAGSGTTRREVHGLKYGLKGGCRGGDPYAGFAVAKGSKSITKGSVRDVDQEHWEQQIGAINKARGTGPQTIAVLAQGRGTSDFGDVPTFAYLQDVFSKVTELS